MPSGMKSAYKSSGAVFEQVSKLYNPGMLEQFRAIEPGELVVVQGTYDHVERLLDTLKAPYELIAPTDIAGHNGGRVMFVNCAAYSKNKTRDAAVQEFVKGGGRLVTTDWALSLVTNVFPGKLKKTKESIDDVVEIQCPTDIARQWTGQNYAQCSPKWWLEILSHIYEAGQGVVPLITSEEMQERYGQPFVAVGFTHGSGEAFHFISHMELQRTRLKGKADAAGLSMYLKKMKVEQTADMEDAAIEELEAAFSTLNTLAYLSIRPPILGGGMKSTLLKPTKVSKIV